ncbi:glycosyltransferase family 4 protein [Pedobacter sp. MR2016-19]|uniref:glycosyltransferase family 4 protein n=1 Tax=Pedobacter sp. MR2016-19 TaxID=2780089 RepID=UPI0018757471|nr:glycosyltransferase family 4 protein [Pedobacter sp. MR2016-19]MBE5321992.1 glycosyltransferase family 4 protein [Pedobacter sp. MR2016-19]
MKILHIVVLPVFAGAQKISFSILENLNDFENKYILCGEGTQKEYAEFDAEFSKINTTVLHNKNLKRRIGLHDIIALIDIYRLCKREKYDIVHTHSTKPGIIARIAAKLAGCQVVHTVHGIAFHENETFIKRIIYYLIEFFSTLFCDKLILVNRFYGKYYSFFSNKIKVIHNGIDFSKITLGHDALQHREDKRVDLLFVGRLDEQKDPLNLLKSFKLLIDEKQYSLYLRIIGTGELYSICEKYINGNNLNDYVSMLGWQSNVAPFYETSDILCIPSIYEAFGLVFVEAGFFSLPSVSTLVEGIPEVILNNKTGILVRPKSPEEFSSALRILINDSLLRKNMGLAAKEWVTEEFSLVKMIESYMSIYKELLSIKS